VCMKTSTIVPSQSKINLQYVGQLYIRSYNVISKTNFLTKISLKLLEKEKRRFVDI